MKLHHLFHVIALLAAVTFSTSQVLGDEKDPHKGHDHEAKSGEAHGDDQGEMDEKMAAWMKYASPGEHHAHLKSLVGSWDLIVRFRMGPDAEWQEEKSSAQSRLILGGRFLLQEVTGEELMGQRFEGLSILGYDNYAKKYTSTWQDTMMTATMTSTGTCDKSGKVFTLTGEYNDPATGKTKKTKHVIRIINENKYTWDGFEVADDGTEFKGMEITYTRK